jgi:hypothetical protein
VQFHIHFVAHFNQQGDVVVGAESSIETETGFNWLWIFNILLFELFQSIAQGLFLLQVYAQPGLCLVQLFPGNFHSLFAAYTAALQHLDAFRLFFWRFLCILKLGDYLCFGLLCGCQSHLLTR